MFAYAGYLKIIAGTVLIVLVTAALAALHHKIYENGFNAGVQHQQDEDKKALAHNQKVFASTDKAVIGIEATSAPAASAASAHTTVVVKTVEKIVHENPDFGAVVRPAALGRLRADQIARLRALAGPGAPPAEPSTSP